MHKRRDLFVERASTRGHIVVPISRPEGVVTLDLHSSALKSTEPWAGLPWNIHGTNMFIVKVQCPRVILTADEDKLLIYDQTKSFTTL